MDLKKRGHFKSDARAANHKFLKPLDCLETLKNGYNLKAVMFSAPKWAGQGGQISLGGSFISKLWENAKKIHEPSMDHTLKLDFVKFIYLE